MRITRLHLRNFRNYVDDSLEPGEGINAFIGQNGQGKSAILEACYVLSTSKSHRTAKDSDMIRLDEDWARISAEIDREEREDTEVEITLARNAKKTVRTNRVKKDRVGDIVGQLNAVVFSASDLDMVKSEPSHRRRFLNLEISQVSPQYVYALGRYKRSLDQRNSTLKEIKRGNAHGKQRSLDVWDEQIASYGAILTEKRMGFLKRLAEIAEPIYTQLSQGTEKLELLYEPSVNVVGLESIEDIKQSFLAQLCNVRDRDFLRGTTTKGPHRDDIAFKVNGMDVRSFGSQGQQRSVALSVKLAEISLIEEMVGEAPVALLDDVGAELDDERRRQVFDLVLGKCQTLVTATSLRELPTAATESATVFTVTAGTVQKS